MRLRKLNDTDREAVTALFLEVFSGDPWHDDWSSREQLTAYIDDLTGQRNSLALGYFDGARLCAASLGCVKHWFRGTEYCVDEFFVDPRLQRHGTGTAFLRDMEALLREMGIRAIFLQTGRTVPAFAFYLKNGFSELEDHVSMSKRIPE